MLKKTLLSTAVILLMVTLCFAADLISGHWLGKIMGAYDIILDLKTDGNKLTGTVSGGTADGKPKPISDGMVKGDSIFFKMPSQTGDPFDVKGKVKADSLSIYFNAMGVDINTTLKKGSN